MAADGKIIVNDRDAGREDVKILRPSEIRAALLGDSADKDTFTK